MEHIGKGGLLLYLRLPISTNNTTNLSTASAYTTDQDYIG